MTGLPLMNDWFRTVRARLKGSASPAGEDLEHGEVIGAGGDVENRERWMALLPFFLRTEQFGFNSSGGDFSASAAWVGLNLIQLTSFGLGGFD